MLRSVSDPKTTKLGTGRFWVIDVVYENQKGESVGTETLHRLRLRRGEMMAERTELTIGTR